MALDKIYIPMTADCEIVVNNWSGIPLSQYDGKPVTSNIEYIRKDALLEWAQQMLDEASSPFVQSIAARTPSVVELIDRLIEQIKQL